MGRVLRYGGLGPDVLERLDWMRRVLGPALGAALRGTPDGIDLRALIAQALHMGDECHSRNRAAQSLLVPELLSGLLKTSYSNQQIGEVLDFLTGRDYFFLNLTMASCKAAWLAAEAVPHASLVTAFSRNGVEFGIRVQGQWFTAPSPVVEGRYFPGYSAEDANLDIGDSAITEASGLGGFAVGGAPAITDFIGGTVAELTESLLQMYEITASESGYFTLPFLDGRGTPTGVDVFRVLQTGICPFITTGIAHKEPGVGQIGAGQVRAPIECFEKAALASIGVSPQR